jgi:hypothetical protein
MRKGISSIKLQPLFQLTAPKTKGAVVVEVEKEFAQYAKDLTEAFFDLQETLALLYSQQSKEK